MAVRIARDYQRALRDFALDVPRCNWWAGTGTGKTSSGLDLFDQRYVFGEVDSMLVISTKRICTMVWPTEVKKWENFRHYTVATAIGTAEQRLAALRRQAHITTINFENLQWLIDKVGIDSDWWKRKMVFADESTELKGLRVEVRKKKDGTDGKVRKTGGSVRADAIAKVAHKRIRYWINATGEPAPNGLIDNWGQMWFIDAGQRLGRTFTEFKDRWFRQVKVGDDAFNYILVPTTYAEREIKERMAPVTLTIEAKDYFDLPPTIINTISVRLPPSAREKYREMEKEMFTIIKTLHSDVEVEAFAAGGKSIKCRQLASGAVIHDSDTREWVEVHSEKIDALRDIIKELNGEPVLVAYEFRSDLQRLQKAFPKGVYFDDKPETLARFMRGEIPILFLHPKSAAHGIDGMQKVCRNVVWFSMTWRLDLFRQLNERVGAMRQVSEGFHREVYVHLLVAENTVEEEMVERIETKATINDALKEAMKRRG